MPQVNGLLVSYCGILCEYCPAYRNKLCPGCDAHAENCKFIKCIQSKNARNCLLCDEFPCKLHEDGFEWTTEEYGILRWKIYSDVFIEIMKRAKSTE